MSVPANGRRATPGPGPATAVQHALDELRRAIISGELKPAERIRQDEVAERFGVSIAPLREALAVLEQEGQVTYRPRRGYSVTELALPDLLEIYELRRLLETRSAKAALPQVDDDALERIKLAARDCSEAARAGDVAAELEANRRFHFGLFEASDQVHLIRLIRLLWDSTEAYRAMYYNSPVERDESLRSHGAIVAAIGRRDEDGLIRELDAHRDRALRVLAGILDR